MQDNHQYPQPVIDFERFFQEHYQPLKQFVVIRVGRGAEAEDIAAETMCQMFEYCQRAECPIKQPRALLFKIARNRIADFYKHQQTHAPAIPLEDAPAVAAPGSLLAAIDIEARIQAVRFALPHIREEYREILTFHAIIGLSVSEIAEMMEKTTMSVRTSLFRARRALRKALRAQEQGKGYDDKEMEQS